MNGAKVPFWFWKFLLTPLREGRPAPQHRRSQSPNFYSRPCGRGDEIADAELAKRVKFLLTPLREGRQSQKRQEQSTQGISTHAPAGGATIRCFLTWCFISQFLLTPLREGRP